MMLHKLMHNPVTVHLRKPRQADWAKLALRVALGAVFMFHGWMKLNSLGATGIFFGKLGIPLAAVAVILVACLEFFGGALVLLGLATRFCAAGYVVIMIAAIITAKDIGLFKTYELEFALLMTALSLLLAGAGAYSLDAMLMKKIVSEHDSSLPMKTKA